jgi:hypothetical protein
MTVAPQFITTLKASRRFRLLLAQSREGTQQIRLHEAGPQPGSVHTCLQELCIKVVAGNFEENPSFGRLPDTYVKKVSRRGQQGGSSNAQRP